MSGTAQQADMVARASAALRAQLRQVIAASALADMPRWIQTGAPPPAAVLRAAGYVGAGGRDPEGLRQVRTAFIWNFGHSIPCREAIEAIRPYGPLVDIGAGAAHWSAMLSAAGVDVIATDLVSDGDSAYRTPIGRYFPVEAIGGVEAVAKHADRNVFCSWPPDKEPWFLDAVRQMQAGRVLALIADGPGGMTATDDLFAFLDASFERLAEVEIPQFPGMADRLTLHRRLG